MNDQVLEGHENMVVNFNGKIDVVYTNLNGKFDTLNTQVKKLETQVAQNTEAVRKQKAGVKERSETGQRHHVNALLDDDFWGEA